MTLRQQALRRSQRHAATAPEPIRDTTPPFTFLPDDAWRAIESTPASFNIGIRRLHEGTVQTSATNREELNEELKGYFLGPMPPSEFLKMFLPPRAGRRAANPFRDLVFPEGIDEVDMYQPFVDAAANLLSPLEIRITASSRKEAAGKLAPDLSVFDPRRDLATSSDSDTLGIHADFSNMLLFVEMKTKTTCDPFEDPPISKGRLKGSRPFERASNDGRSARGQITSYLTAQVGSQYRCFAFAVGIFDNLARIFRWDPSGIIVTRAFDYTKGSFLAEFFWRFGALTPAERGEDPTVSRIDEEWPTCYAPERALKALVKYDETLSSRSVQPARTESDEDPERRHQYFCIMKIPSPDDPSLETDIIISFPPKLRPLSLIGTSPVFLYGYDTVTKKLVFVKQYWRAYTQGMLKEGDVYKHLVAHDVRNLAPFGKGNDVRKLKTTTHTIYCSDPRWIAIATNDMIPYRLYRMYIDTTGRLLLDFRSSREFLSVVRDAMQCHDDAYFLGGILHRNVTTTSILILEDGSGVLMGFEACVAAKRDPTLPCPRAPNRAAPLQFMSASMLRDPTQSQTLLDDRESAFWMILWTALHYLKHNHQDYMETWKRVFDTRNDRGVVKKQLLIDNFNAQTGIFLPGVPTPLTFRKNSALTGLLDSLKQFFMLRYTGAGLSNLEEPQEIPDVFRDKLQSAMNVRQGIHAILYPRISAALTELEERDHFVQWIERALSFQAGFPETDEPAQRNHGLGNPDNASGVKIKRDNLILADRAPAQSFEVPGPCAPKRPRQSENEEVPGSEGSPNFGDTATITQVQTGARSGRVAVSGLSAKKRRKLNGLA